jgi:hypothetical protein
LKYGRRFRQSRYLSVGRLGLGGGGLGKLKRG